MTKSQFKAKAEAAFRKANPTAQITGWIDARLVTYPTGIKEYAGKFQAVADGHRTRVMIASGSADYVMVR
jgi:hypothetical protein